MRIIASILLKEVHVEGSVEDLIDTCIWLETQQSLKAYVNRAGRQV